MTNRNSVTFVFSLLLLGSVPALRGQGAETNDRAEDANEIIVTTVHHANAHAIAETIRNLGVPIAADAVSDATLVMRGPKAVLKKITDDVLPLIDKPATTASEAPPPHFIRIKQEKEETVMSLIDAVVTDRKTRVAMDRSSGLLAVQGSERDVSAIRQLLEQLDRPRKALTVTFYFLRGAMAETSQGKAATLPKALAPIAQTLADTGLSQLTTMAPVIVRVDEEQEFASVSVSRSSDSSSKETLSYHVSGMAIATPGTNVVQVRLSAEIGGFVGDPDKGKNNVGFEINTTIATKLGDYVLLAAGPSTTAGGDAVALILRVTAD